MLEQKWRKGAPLDMINLGLAVGLILLPGAFGFATVKMATSNAWISGIMIGAAAIGALLSFSEWEEWINLLLGLRVAISPWLLNFHLSISEAALRAQMALGLVVAVLAAAELWMSHRAPPRITA